MSKSRVAGHCLYQLSERGVAILLLQEACHICISSATNIVVCLVSVAVSHTSLSVRRRAGMLVWRRVP